jgi:hypothetical protein
MKKTPLQIFALAAVLSAVGGLSLGASQGARASKDATLEALAGYRQWASVRGEPGRVTLAMSSVPIDASEIAI